jgi:8-oxo-dGTP pyrophosphatase MutT (NUDIX family)
VGARLPRRNAAVDLRLDRRYLFSMAANAEARETVAPTSLEVIRTRIAARLADAALTTTVELAQEPAPNGRAAVAIVLREVHSGPEVLLIRRAERQGDPWSGHMAFPGGREAPSDGSLLTTALRETREELSLDLDVAGRLLGRLRELPAVARGRSTGMVIAPFVFELTREVSLSYKIDEVSEALWAPLHPLMHGSLRSTIAYELAGQSHTLPAHDVEGRKVWGLTYRMLEDLFTLLR